MEENIRRTVCVSLLHSVYFCYQTLTEKQITVETEHNKTKLQLKGLK